MTDLTTVAQLLYVNPPDLRLTALQQQLAIALRECPATPVVDHPDDRTVITDLLGNRILLRWQTDCDGDHRACLTVAVGTTPGAEPGGLARRQDIVARIIADKITRQAAPDTIQWHHQDSDLTPDLIDQMTRRLPARTATRVAREITRLQEMAQLREGLLRGPWAPANDTPQLPHPQVLELARVRAALEEQPTAPSTALRLAAHAINATMVCVALPVGAAMMTYSLMRGENLTASARMLAVLGLAVGAQNVGLAQDILPTF
jgi:hypothetical protein